MKTSLLAFFLLAVLGGWEGVSAQTPQTPAKPSKDATMFGPEGRIRDKLKERFLENMPPEIRQRFQAAREKALQDPTIQGLRESADKANNQFFKAMRDKMMEIDPGLADVIKEHAGGWKNKEKGGGESKGWKERRGEESGNAPGLGNLTEDERQKLMAARENAKKDPTVQAAEQKKQEAQTPEERKAASEVYREAIKTAMLKADPSLAPLIEKMGPKPAKASGDASGGMMMQE